MIPCLAFAGNSGVGKTTLIAGVLGILRGQGLRVGVIKHSGGFADPDQPGKDSFVLRRAGAERLVLAGPDATVCFHRHPGAEPSFEARLALLGEGLDLVLVESYRSRELPTIEVLRKGHSETARFEGTPRLVAIAADFPPGGDVPWLPLGDPGKVAEFVAGFLVRA
ncbi:MAG: molybdopterin-guanine dinucleotide biosynthesis protein B [Planctomycetota bacterium]